MLEGRDELNENAVSMEAVASLCMLCRRAASHDARFLPKSFLGQNWADRANRQNRPHGLRNHEAENRAPALSGSTCEAMDFAETIVVSSTAHVISENDLHELEL